MKKLVAGLTISLFIAMAAIVYAQGHGMMGEGPEMGPGFMGRGLGMTGEQHMLKKLMSLGLDEKQEEAIKEIVRTTQKETIKKRADLSIARIDLKDLLDKDPVNMTAVESTLKQIESLNTDIHLSHIKSLEAIKAKLTPDQRKRLKEMREHGMMGKMGMMKHKGCEMMGGMKCGKMGEMKEGMMGGMKCGKMGDMTGGMKDGMKGDTKGGTMQQENMETAPRSSGSDEEMPEMEQNNQ
jgi:Spy/CpxP family protein refolding chaperone